MVFSARQQWLALALGAGVLLAYGGARLIKAFLGRAAPVKVEVMTGAPIRQAQPPPSAPEVKPGPTPVAAGPSYPIDLNRASAAELEAVPGIGPETAKRILALREKLGGFRSLDQLTQIQGIKEKRLAELVPYLRLAPPG